MVHCTLGNNKAATTAWTPACNKVKVVAYDKATKLLRPMLPLLPLLRVKRVNKFKAKLMTEHRHRDTHTLTHTRNTHTRQQLWHCRAVIRNVLVFLVVVVIHVVNLAKGWTNIEAAGSTSSASLRPLSLSLHLCRRSRFAIFTEFGLSGLCCWRGCQATHRQSVGERAGAAAERGRRG